MFGQKIFDVVYADAGGGAAGGGPGCTESMYYDMKFWYQLSICFMVEENDATRKLLGLTFSSRIRFVMASLRFFADFILSAAIWFTVDSACNRNEYQRSSLGEG